MEGRRERLDREIMWCLQNTAGFLQKPLRARSRTQPRLCPWPRAPPCCLPMGCSGTANIRPRRAWLLWVSPGLLSEKCHFVCHLSSSACSRASGMRPPQWSLSRYQGDEGVLGSECADRGVNGWSGLSEQGLTMCKGNSSAKTPRKLAAPRRLAHSFPSFRISVYFQTQGTQGRQGSQGFWSWCLVACFWPWKILLLWSQYLCLPKNACV